VVTPSVPEARHAFHQGIRPAERQKHLAVKMGKATEGEGVKIVLDRQRPPSLLYYLN
jgi:hypothetical protein